MVSTSESWGEADEGAPPAGQNEPPYRATKQGLVHLKATKDGEVEVPLTNFGATIVAEIRRDDGAEIHSAFEIEAHLDGRAIRFEVRCTEFARMDWAIRNLGPTAIVNAGFSAKDHARAAIQHLSRDVDVRTVFGHLGWRSVDDAWVYLHAAGAIGPVGTVPGVEVDLLEQLQHYELPEPPADDELRRAVWASLEVLSLLPERVTIPLYCAIWRAPLGPTDCSVHVAGQTGEGKSAYVALIQQHYGPELDDRKLPGSWLSTGNSLEVLAFAAKDALLVVDDYAPQGSRVDDQRLQKEAARLFRAKGNQAGRGRLRPDGSLRPTKPPRALVVSTGEDVPAGHSVRARMFIVEIPAGSMDWNRLTECQKVASEGLYAKAMAGYLRWLAPRYGEVRARLRSRLVDLREQASRSLAQHRRTPAMVGDLAFGMEMFLDFALDVAAVTAAEAEDLQRRTWAALIQAAQMQAEHLADANPVPRFLELLRSAVTAGRAHLASAQGLQPLNPQVWGWRAPHRGGEQEVWEPLGDRIGWVDGPDLYLEPESAFRAALQMASEHGVGVTPKTLWKRLKESGLLASTDETRQRNTIRVTLQGSRRKVLHLGSATLMAGTPSQPSQVSQDGDEAGVTGPLVGDGFVYPAPQPSLGTVPQGGVDAACPAPGGLVGTVGTVPETEDLDRGDDEWGEE